MKQYLLLLALMAAVGCGSKKQETGKNYYLGSEDSVSYHKSEPISITPYNIDSFVKAGLIKGDYEVTEWVDSDGWKKRIFTFTKNKDTVHYPTR